MLAAAVLGMLATGCAAKGPTVATPRPFPGAAVPPRSGPVTEQRVAGGHRETVPGLPLSLPDRPGDRAAGSRGCDASSRPLARALPPGHALPQRRQRSVRL